MNLTIKPINEKAYLEFGEKQENWSFLQTPEQKRKMQNGIYETELIGFYDENNQLQAAAMLAFAPVARIYQYCLISGGILMDYHSEPLAKAVTQAMKDYLGAKNTLYMEMTPYIPLVEHDRNGDVVEGGLDNRPVTRMFEELGYRYRAPKKGTDNSGNPVWMSVLRLEGKDMDTLLKEMDQQTRWSINRARKFGLTVRKAHSDEDMRRFAEMMVHTGKRNHFDGMDEDYYRRELAAWQDRGELMLAFMEPEKTIESQTKLKAQSEKELDDVIQKLEQTPSSKKFNKKKKVLEEAIGLAEKKIEEARNLQQSYGNEILLAGSIFLNTEKETVYMHSGAYDEFFKYNAPYAIHYEEIRKAVEQNKDTYNFYGISGNFEKDQEGYSLFDFKRGFGCVVVENLGTLILPVKDFEFGLYNRLKKLI